jgi:hypothetical protein
MNIWDFMGFHRVWSNIQQGCGQKNYTIPKSYPMVGGSNLNFCRMKMDNMSRIWNI